MQKILAVFLLTILFAMLVAAPVLAARQGPPVGSCPPGFEMHPFMDHQDHHDHHIGLAQDLNQDGYTCVQHLPSGYHVHVDNVLP